MQGHMIPHDLDIVMWYHMTQLPKRAPMSIGASTYISMQWLNLELYLYRKTYVAKWIVDINNNVSVMFGKCIMIVDIMNNVSVMFDKLY